MFDRIAPRYDLANRLMSLGMDQWWRRQSLAALGPAATGEVLDLCCGTMDFTVMLLEGGARRVVAADFSEGMLDAGASKLPAGAPVQRVVADARDLPLPDASLDGILCGFGLRNVPEVEAAVAECARVLRPGGRLVVLELFQPAWWLPRLLQGSYNKLAVPLMGGMITGFGDAYRYLEASIDAFVTRSEFEAMLERQGLRSGGRDLLPPVAGLVWGDKPGEVQDV
jgi:ubiquinone/menaquinone biosynthesis methyltransferase